MATRRLTAAQAAELIRPVDSIAVPLGPGQPGDLLRALGAREEYDDLWFGGALLLDLYDVFTRPGVHYHSGFFGPAERVLLSMGADVQFVPADFRRFAPILQADAPRVMTTVATPPDADGWMSLSLHSGATVAELQRAAADPDRLLMVETSASFPRTVGVGDYRHALHVDAVDVVIEGTSAPYVLEDPEPTDVDRAIAEFAASFVRDGSTLQTGIGGIPSTVARILAAGPLGDFGVHSEMFTTGLMHLHKAGKVSNLRKGVHEGYSVTTFALGTTELYEWMDQNDDVRFLPVEQVNDPGLIARNHEVVAINGAIAVDLSGQVVADTVGPRQYSGIGGHEDFIAVSGEQLEDRGLICMASTVTVDGVVRSRLHAALPQGWIVTTPRHQVDVVITEYGIAELRGRTVKQRAEALIAIAHPDHRDELRAAYEG